MNLLSCRNCGVVLDKDCLGIDADLDEQIAEGRAVWNGVEYIPVVSCPVCNEDVELS